MTTYITTIDIPTLHRHAIGFDRLFQELNRTFANSKTDGNYPPYNIIQTSETHYQIDIAVAGFSENDLDIELKDNLLTVRGQQEKNDDEVNYWHRGLATRNFTKTFPLGEYVEVRSALVKNGILSIALELIVPEEQKPKKIAITFTK